MNKIFLITLTTTILTTSGFSSEHPTYGGHIDSTISIGGALLGSHEGRSSTFQIKHENYELSHTGMIQLAKNNTQSNVGKLIIDSEKSLKSTGGTITSFGSGTYSPRITLNGTLVMECIDDQTPNLEGVEIDSSNTGETYGLLDMSAARLSTDQEATEQLEHISHIKIIAPTEGKNAPRVKLPFNCKFTDVDLSNASHVEYTCINEIKVEATEGQNIGMAEQMGTNEPVAGYLIQKIQQADAIGDYAKNAELGVKLPTTPGGKLDPTKVTTIIQQGRSDVMDLTAMASNRDYNANGYYLKTDDLDNTQQNIAGDTEYNFGLVGSTPIKISGEHEITFKGNNRAYTPASGSLTLPEKVEFAGNGALFPISQEYQHGTFTAGSNLSNTVPSGEVIAFRQGFTLGTGHKLTVSGNLIG